MGRYRAVKKVTIEVAFAKPHAVVDTFRRATWSQLDELVARSYMLRRLDELLGRFAMLQQLLVKCPSRDNFEQFVEHAASQFFNSRSAGQLWYQVQITHNRFIEGTQEEIVGRECFIDTFAT